MKHTRLFLFLAFFAVSACGTLFCGQRQTILVDSAPSGVEILRNGVLLGTTPRPFSWSARTRPFY